MISQFANPTDIQAVLSAHPLLERFAHEFCKEFNCLVSGAAASMRPSVTIATADGLPAGTLQIDSRGAQNRDGAYIPVYYFTGNSVRKAKGSARSNANTRDSTNIRTLLSAVKKNNEAPSHDTLLKHYINGIRYAFVSTLRTNRSARIELNQDEALALVLSHLKLDTNSVDLHNQSIQEKYKQFIISSEQNMENNRAHNRFCEGSYLIGYMGNMGGRYYLVADVSAKQKPGADVEEFTFHTPLKRYNSLMECPEIAPHVPIIRAWAEGKPNFDKENELGLPSRDVYYDDIDVASGYSSVSEPWFLIPKTPT